MMYAASYTDAIHTAAAVVVVFFLADIRQISLCSTFLYLHDSYCSGYALCLIEYNQTSPSVAALCSRILDTVSLFSGFCTRIVFYCITLCAYIFFFILRFFLFSSDARNYRNFHPQCQRKILHIKHSIDVLFKQMFHPNAHIYSNKINNVFILFASFRSIFAHFHTIVALFIC